MNDVYVIKVCDDRYPELYLRNEWRLCLAHKTGAKRFDSEADAQAFIDGIADDAFIARDSVRLRIEKLEG